MTSLVRHSTWFLTRDGGPASGVQIFCFPYGGGSPRVYLDWQPVLGDDAQIVAVCPPGRDHRVDERAPSSIAELADGAAAAIRAYADRPTVLFGHSLGALVAFEVARRVSGSAAFVHLVASGCAAPSLIPSDYIRWAAQLSGQDFADAAGRYEGLSPEVVADPELQELLLPDLRADLRLVAEYRYRPAAPLPVGVSLVNGRDDWHITEAALEPWRRECQAAPRYHWTDGGHFYFDGRPSTVVEVLRSVVREPSAGAAVAAAEHVEVI
ncbi:MAG TPA: alpha/beta fold hydrolase [Micromonosporaceae bacterium]|nr:alpha/beta fold hydrolase [Micromonosporaceae bacterium]